MADGYSFADAVIEVEKALQEGSSAFTQTVASLRVRHSQLSAGSAEMHAVVELALRQSLQNSIERGGVDEAEAARVTDAAVASAASGAADGGLPFVLMEDVFESLTLRQCAGVFGAFEARVEQLRELAEEKKPRLRLLHAAVSLLHRLARPASVALKGRLLLFLAKALPLSDKSGLNTRGGSNEANTTEVEDSSAMEVDQGEGLEASAVSPALHASFWQLQDLFRDPTKAAAQLDTLEGAVNKVLSLFTTVIGAGVSPVKKKMSASAPPFVPAAIAAQESAGEGEDRMDVDEGEEAASEKDPFVKYLTAPQLLHLQIQDEHFRRHFLLQLLVLLNTLLRHTQDGDHISETQRTTLSSIEERAKELLRHAPDGVRFVHTVEHLLEREAGWVEWKADNCKPFEREPLGGDRKEKATETEEEMETGTETETETKSKEESSKQKAHAGTSGEERLFMGNAELTRLWRQGANDSSIATARIQPSLEEFLQPLADQLEPDSGVEDEYLLKHDKVFVWKSMRLVLKSNRLNYFSKVDGDVEKLVAVLDEERKAAKEALEAGEITQMDTST